MIHRNHFNTRHTLQALAGVLVAVLATGALVATVWAQEVNCANEFRSGKLYFSQKVYEKAVSRFALAVETCPDKGEYRARYAMALCEMGKAYIGNLPFATPGERDTLQTKGAEFYKIAGEQFDAALETEQGKKKKLQKFVRENRGHYWADNYNEAIELQEKDEFASAELHFRIARLLDKSELRTYSSEAVVLMRQGKVHEAMDLVDLGLESDPENERLVQIKASIVLDVARNLAEEADKDKDCEKLGQALAYYDDLLNKDASDPNLLFERGLARLIGGTIDCASEGQNLQQMAADDFLAASALVDPEGENRQFFVDCKFNQLQAMVSAGNSEAALAVAGEYTCLDPLDPAGWQMMAPLLIDSGDQAAVVATLMMSKSLSGSEVPVDQATGDAKSGAKEALDSLGKPDLVMTYQESSSGNQIQTWIWQQKQKAMSFILGDKQGEVSWCQ